MEWLAANKKTKKKKNKQNKQNKKSKEGHENVIFHFFLFCLYDLPYQKSRFHKKWAQALSEKTALS